MLPANSQYDRAMNGTRRLAAATVLSLLFVGSATISAYAWSVPGSEVTYAWVPSRDLCYTNDVDLNGNHNLATGEGNSWMRERPNTACLAGTTQPIGTNWTGVRSWVVKASGQTCAATVWKFNGGSTVVVSYADQQVNDGCNATIQGQSRSQGYDPVAGDYVLSNIRQTPSQPYPWWN